MPIKPGIQIEPISNSDFHSIDYEIMGLVFSIHRDFGRFWNEMIYRNELAYRCQKAGSENVATEVPIEVSFDHFIKFYYIKVFLIVLPQIVLPF